MDSQMLSVEKELDSRDVSEWEKSVDNLEEKSGELSGVEKVTSHMHENGVSTAEASEIITDELNGISGSNGSLVPELESVPEENIKSPDTIEAPAPSKASTEFSQDMCLETSGSASEAQEKSDEPPLVSVKPPDAIEGSAASKEREFYQEDKCPEGEYARLVVSVPVGETEEKKVDGPIVGSASLVVMLGERNDAETAPESVPKNLNAGEIDALDSTKPGDISLDSTLTVGNDEYKSIVNVFTSEHENDGVDDCTKKSPDDVITDAAGTPEKADAHPVAQSVTTEAVTEGDNVSTMNEGSAVLVGKPGLLDSTIIGSTGQHIDPIVEHKTGEVIVEVHPKVEESLPSKTSRVEAEVHESEGNSLDEEVNNEQLDVQGKSLNVCSHASTVVSDSPSIGENTLRVNEVLEETKHQNMTQIANLKPAEPESTSVAAENSGGEDESAINCNISSIVPELLRNLGNNNEDKIVADVAEETTAAMESTVVNEVYSGVRKTMEDLLLEEKRNQLGSSGSSSREESEVVPTPEFFQPTNETLGSNQVVMENGENTEVSAEAVKVAELTQDKKGNEDMAARDHVEPSTEMDSTEKDGNDSKNEALVKPSQRSNNVISIVKKSIVKVKKAITGKSPSQKNTPSRDKENISDK